MSRTLCLTCQRPQKACICAFITKVKNNIHVIILQHPSEVSQTKGTVTLLAKSLQSCQVLVGESFDLLPSFLPLIDQYQPLLLYPSQQAKTLSIDLLTQLAYLTPNLARPQGSINDNVDVKDQSKPRCLVILDGTWKKAYRMYRLSTILQNLPQVCLPERLANAGQYHIRKVAKNNALSSLEACCYALALLEAVNDFDSIKPQQAAKYQPLLDKFNQFNQFQLSFRPEHKLFKET